MNYTLIFILGLLLATNYQDRPDLVGSWKWVSYYINGENVLLKYEDVLVLNQDGSYKNICNSRLDPELKVCETGHWKLNKNTTLHLDRDKSPNGTILFPRDRVIEKFNSDSLVFKGKEGPKDIISYYIRQK